MVWSDMERLGLGGAAAQSQMVMEAKRHGRTPDWESGDPRTAPVKSRVRRLGLGRLGTGHSGLCCFCLSCTHSPFQKQPRFPWGTPFPMLSYDVWVRLALC